MAPVCIAKKEPSPQEENGKPKKQTNTWESILLNVYQMINTV